jgi:hypothetical protein
MHMGDGSDAARDGGGLFIFRSGIDKYDNVGRLRGKRRTFRSAHHADQIRLSDAITFASPPPGLPGRSAVPIKDIPSLLGPSELSFGFAVGSVIYKISFLP